MPASRQARTTRTAISPRLATRTLASVFATGLPPRTVSRSLGRGRRRAGDSARVAYRGPMTSFTLSREHEEFRAVVREFAADKIAPHAAEWDRKHYFPVETV